MVPPDVRQAPEAGPQQPVARPPQGAGEAARGREPRNIATIINNDNYNNNNNSNNNNNYCHINNNIGVDDLPTPWCFFDDAMFLKTWYIRQIWRIGSQNLKTFTESEGRGSQNLQHLPNLKVEVPKTLNIHRICTKQNQTVNIEVLCKIVRFPGGILHPIPWGGL